MSTHISRCWVSYTGNHEYQDLVKENPSLAETLFWDKIITWLRNVIRWRKPGQSCNKLTWFRNVARWRKPGQSGNSSASAVSKLKSLFNSVIVEGEDKNLAMLLDKMQDGEIKNVFLGDSLIERNCSLKIESREIKMIKK